MPEAPAGRGARTLSSGAPFSQSDLGVAALTRSPADSKLLESRMPEERRYALQPFFGPGRADMTQYTPHARRLRMRVVETGPGMAVLTLPYHDELIGDPVRRVVFGGVITTLIDQASGLAVACAMEELAAVATIDLRVDYLRAAEPGCDLFARSECYKLTRNVAFVRATAWERSPDDPFAGCLGTFMVGANQGGAPFGRLIADEAAKS
ncbi:MAG: PaaI family thioesterase [Deltaproteobacteria bacterium]|nr:PaaI family thioesterase [Deltaproteobacteria bacterium]